MTRTFRQVDVFTGTPYLGNPLAVVHDADGLTDGQMRRFSSWTNLSETTFLLAPREEQAELLTRIERLAAMIRYGMRMLGDAPDAGRDRADRSESP